MSHAPGRFVWHELMTDKIEDARAFYSEVLGWKIEAQEMPGGMVYHMIKAGDLAVGGMMTAPEQVPTHWMGYVSVQDVDASAAAIVRAGGKPLMDAIEMPGVGRFQGFMDPQGAVFSIFRAAEGDPEPSTGPGTFSWDELWAKDPDSALDFYQSVFDYSHSSMDMPNGTYYMMMRSEQEPAAGLMGAPPSAPPAWVQYVVVDDVQAAIVRAERMGGGVMAPPMDAEGVGRFAVLMDPEGASIGIITPASGS